jgi:hypothetical protein
VQGGVSHTQVILQCKDPTCNKGKTIAHTSYRKLWQLIVEPYWNWVDKEKRDDEYTANEERIVEQFLSKRARKILDGTKKDLEYKIRWHQDQLSHPFNRERQKNLQDKIDALEEEKKRVDAASPLINLLFP